MRVNEHNLDSLRKIIRDLQTENEKLKQKIKDRMLEAPRSESVILIATGQKIGEGLNFP